jgi:hypothetical protein
MIAPVSGRDVYGKRRPQGASCSIGAVEGDLEKEVADKTVGGPAWPGVLDQSAKVNGSGGKGGGTSAASKRCCCCRR